jgi:propanol-preferring alcohol dehydrogenase
MNKTMKAAVCKEFETIVIEDVPVPEPGNGQVLVRVKAKGARETCALSR